MKYAYIEAWHFYSKNVLGMEGKTNKYLRWQITDAYASSAPFDAVHKRLDFSLNYENPKWHGEWVTVRDLIEMNILDLRNPSLQHFLGYAANYIQVKESFKLSREAHKKANPNDWNVVDPEVKLDEFLIESIEERLIWEGDNVPQPAIACR